MIHCGKSRRWPPAGMMMAWRMKRSKAVKKIYCHRFTMNPPCQNCGVENPAHFEYQVRNLVGSSNLLFEIPIKLGQWCGLILTAIIFNWLCILCMKGCVMKFMLEHCSWSDKIYTARARPAQRAIYTIMKNK